jgi:hypothetical protein
LACAAALALFGCGDDDGPANPEPETNEFTTPEPESDDFVAEANEICIATEDAAELYNDEIESAGLHSPESVRYLRRAAAARRRGLAELQAVRPPEEDAAAYAEFLRAYEVNLVKLEDVADSIERGDVDEARRIEEEVNLSTEEESDPLAAELGIDECASG